MRLPALFPLLTLLGVAVVAYEPPSQKCKAVVWSGGNSIEWPSPATKAQYKSEGKYIGRNVIATRAVIHKDDAYLALPRYKSGVPFTLARISLKGRNCRTSLSPFPRWSLHDEGNCAALQNVVDVFLDAQDILWALDTGVVNSFEATANRTCPPKVVAVNARSGKVVKYVDLSSLTNNESHLQYVIADYSYDGRVFAYVSDASNRAILVFDVSSARGYRLILPEHVALGSTKRDVLYIGLVRRPDHANFLLLSYINSKHVYAIATSYLHSGEANARIDDLGPKLAKIVFLGTDNGSAVFYRREGESDVYRWDLMESPISHYMSIQRVYKGNNYALPTQVSVDLKRGRIRILESNFPDFFQGTVGCGVNHALRLF
ncbi:major royal jelly protein 5-like [Phymastichus coffea]|uniref:major royal jelly protein 5-like n=1 Tax=Phymastichus coffea TaxID=108790 RepID=UPI00273CCC14|nr:major royal jelly protein 5-like [Phymastichus coffea]